MPRVAIENLKLIEFGDLFNLIGKDLETIRCALADSTYSEQISPTSQDTLDYAYLEAALTQNYVETVQKLVKFSSGNIKKLLLAFLKKLEVSNIKTMLRAAKAQIDVNETMKHIVPIGAMNRSKYRAIFEASESYEDVIKVLAGSKYGKLLKRVTDEHGDTEKLRLLEVALDTAVYREILDTIEKLTGVDKKIAQEVIGIELDAINVKIILKSKELAVNPEIMKTYLMPTAVFDEEILVGIMKAADVKSMLERLSLNVEFAHPVYKRIFTQMLKESNVSLSQSEAILDKAPLEMSLAMLKEHSRYYNLGFILAFLYLKWAEVKNLRCIVKGSERKSPPSQVRKLLMIPDEWRTQLSCVPS